MHQERFGSLIEDIIACAKECEGCFDMDLQDEDRLNCARANADCARACWETAAAISRNSPFSVQYCGHCAAICDGCAEVCSEFDNEHCKACAEACKKCAQKCRDFAHAEVGP
jgi:hypothetical protein